MPLKITFIIILLIVSAIVFSYFYLPVNRVGIISELIMLGDLNNDNRWDNKDKDKLNDVLANPFFSDRLTLLKIDINKNELIDKEDLILLEHMYKFSDPYLSEQKADEQGIHYPRPREFFKYLPKYEYVQRPLYSLNHNISKTSPFSFLKDFQLETNTFPYERQLLHEVYNEAIRFSFAYALRDNRLTEIEKDYVRKKIQYCEELFGHKKYFPLLLNLISLVEDAETLTIKGQSDFIRKVLYFRDHLKELLVSADFISFNRGQISYSEIYKRIEEALKADLDISLEFNSLPPPRDFSNLQNYLDRAEWQAFKSKTKQDDFKQLVLYAQYDRRYLRAVSKTSPKQHDIQLQNHNLPMILLFREALKIKKNNKKAAVALLDEAIRIPLGWVKSIPKNLLPSSVALENFLLPGNKEDGLDKSRHWNVFGGVAIYKSPEESLILALKRENMDLKDQNFSPEAMQEFIRDTIANINGIYYMVSINPDLIPGIEG
jgi:hypothetical protein